jgi:hypothetical protein
MFDSTKQFARQFRPVEGGYLYFPGRWGKGYLVSPDEYDQLCEEWKRVAGWSGILRLVGFIILGIILVLTITAWLGLPSETTDGPELLLALAVPAYLVWKAAAPYRLVRHREPIAPRRTPREVEGDMARNIGWPMAVLLAVLSLWFIVMFALAAIINPLVGVPLLLFFSIAAYLNGRAIFRKWADRKT